MLADSKKISFHIASAEYRGKIVVLPIAQASYIVSKQLQISAWKRKAN